MTVLIGTSGWQYTDWRGVLYPVRVPQRRWLAEYGRAFATVENNSSFYRLPRPETFAGWRDGTPEDFVMAVKASRFLTHLKRLRDPAEPVQRLMGRAEELGARLGPVLLQLPPDFPVDLHRIDACLQCFPEGVRVAVELRHPSWWEEERPLRDVLERHDAALCWADRGSRPVTPLWRTAGWGYVRLHEGAARPWPRYGRAALRSWAARIAGAFADGEDVHVYFNNDPGGAAVLDAVDFARAVAHSGRGTTRTPPPADVRAKPTARV